MKDELHSQEELSVAAVAYIPPIWLGLLLFHRWRKNYYTRYHLVHAALVNLTVLGILVGVGLFTNMSTHFTGHNLWLVLITGGLIGASLLIGAGVVFFCAVNAYRGRYTVLPIITRIYYLLFSQRAIKSDNLYDSRRITHLRPYLNQEEEKK